MVIGLSHYLVLSGVLFVLGLYGTLTKRNAIALLMSIELLFNAVNVAFVAVARYTPIVGLDAERVRLLLTGQVFALFVITVAAAEVALGLAIVMSLYRSRDTVDVTEANLMRR
jgi:NADH:ubiquinone oxidoreductase subunit K